MVKRLQKIRTDRIVEHKRQMVCARNRCNCFKVGHIQLRIADAFRIYRFCLGVIAAFRFSGFEESTNLTVMPNFAKVYLKRLYVPP